MRRCRISYFNLFLLLFISACNAPTQSPSLSPGGPGSGEGSEVAANVGNGVVEKGSSVTHQLGGGTIDGNGGDKRPLYADAAWFLNLPNNEIRYCLEVSPDFGVSPQTLNDRILESFKNWFQYIERKEINQALTEEGFSFPERASRDFSEPLPQTLGEYSDCQGNEHIQFAFGTSSQEIRTERLKYGSPAAFGFQRIRSQTSANRVENSGVIWISPPNLVFADGEERVRLDWQDPLDLKMILNHEIGQIFGITYVPGTIMDQDAVRIYLREKLAALVGKRSLDREKWAAIDQTQELYICADCKDNPLSYEGKLTPILEYEMQSVLEALLPARRKLMGEEELIQVSLQPVFEGDWKPRKTTAIRIVFKGEGWQEELEMSLSAPLVRSGVLLVGSGRVIQTRSIAPIFTLYTDALAEPRSLSHSWQSILGSVTLRGTNLGAPERVTLSLEQNHNHSPLRIRVLSEGPAGPREFLLFEAKLVR